MQSQKILIKLTIALLFLGSVAKAQNTEADSLKKLLHVTEQASARVRILEGLSYAYLGSYPDTALQYAMDGLQLAKNTGDRKGESICINALGNVYFHIGDNAREENKGSEFVITL